MNQSRDFTIIFRGEIWWANMPKPQGSEPGYRRPVLIIQNNRFNRSRLATVMVVALTTNLDLAELPGNVLVPAFEAGLEEESVVNITQVVTLDRHMLETLFFNQNSSPCPPQGLRAYFSTKPRASCVDDSSITNC